MKVLRFDPSESYEKVFTLQLSFDPGLGRLAGTVGTHSPVGDLILEIDIDLNRWVGKLIECKIAMTEKGYEIVVYDALKNYSIGNGMPSNADNRNGFLHRLFRVFVHENVHDSILQICHAHEALEGFDDIVEDGNYSLRMFNMVRHDAQADKLLKKVRLKSEMLGVVDQRDSVSYLEAQVDILTRLVLELHQGDTRPLTEILRKADEHSVLTIKDEAALANEFTAKKAWVRTVQKDYYDAKKALEATTA